MNTNCKLFNFVNLRCGCRIDGIDWRSKRVRRVVKPLVGLSTGVSHQLKKRAETQQRSSTSGSGSLSIKRGPEPASPGSLLVSGGRCVAPRLNEAAASARTSVRFTFRALMQGHILCHGVTVRMLRPACLLSMLLQPAALCKGPVSVPQASLPCRRCRQQLQEHIMANETYLAPRELFNSLGDLAIGARAHPKPQLLPQAQPQKQAQAAFPQYQGGPSWPVQGQPSPRNGHSDRPSHRLPPPLPPHQHHYSFPTGGFSANLAAAALPAATAAARHAASAAAPVPAAERFFALPQGPPEAPPSPGPSLPPASQCPRDSAPDAGCARTVTRTDTPSSPGVAASPAARPPYPSPYPGRESCGGPAPSSSSSAAAVAASSGAASAAGSPPAPCGFSLDFHTRWLVDSVYGVGACAGLGPDTVAALKVRFFFFFQRAGPAMPWPLRDGLPPADSPG